MLKHIDLQLFAEAEGNPNAEGESAGADESSQADGSQQPEKNAAAESEKEAPAEKKTIDMEEAERIASRREDKARQAALKDYFKQQGLSEDEARNLLKEAKEAREARKTELKKALEKATAAEKTAAEAQTKANSKLIQAQARVMASELGVSSVKMPHLLKLAADDLAKVQVADNGEVGADEVKAALEKVLADIPELKTEQKKEEPKKQRKGETPDDGKDNKDTDPFLKGFNM